MKTVEHLKKIPLFQSIPEGELLRLDENLRPVSIAKGEIIISEGEVGDCLYIIRRGQVKVIAEVKDAEEPVVLSFLGAGDYFGEMALITGEPRSATVLAEQDCSLYEVKKTDFDNLVMNNPAISLSLTHMLSQRLNLSNKARERSERYYKNRITPHGSLDEVDLIKLLKYAEENSLTGQIRLNNNEQEAFFIYSKGQLEKLEFEGKEEDEAMDEILDWSGGTFIIEPSVYKLPQEEEAGPEKVLEDSLKISLFERYIKEKFGSLIKFAGARMIQTALNKSYYKFEKYFDTTSEIRISVEPKCTVTLQAIDGWSDKHTLFLSVLMRDVIEALGRDLLGMEFWEFRAGDEEIDRFLESSQFYTYYEQAVDFIRE